MLRIGEGGAITRSTLSSGNATLRYNISALAAGTYSITATYSGDTNFVASTSHPVTLTVTSNATKASTATSASVTPSSIAAGATSGVSLSATVTPASGASATPTGTITFFNGTTQIAPAVTLSSGAATLRYNTSSLAANSYSITAAYSGDSSYSGSTSQPVTLIVTPPSTSPAPGFTALYAFNPESSGIGPGFLVQYSDGSLYGTTGSSGDPRPAELPMAAVLFSRSPQQAR